MTRPENLTFQWEVARYFADQNRDRKCAAWDPMLAGVLHGIGQLAWWKVFRKRALTFQALTSPETQGLVRAIIENDNDDVPKGCKFRPVLEQAHALALQINALLNGH
jgi:hypothetical protein